MTFHILAHTLKGHCLHVRKVADFLTSPTTIEQVEDIAKRGFWRGISTIYYPPSSIYTLEVVDEERYQELKRRGEVI